jgi:hypothetical protein
MSTEMTRLKSIAFVLVALSLWIYHLMTVSPLLVAGGSAASAAVTGAPQAVALAIESGRSQLSLALSALTSNISAHATPKAGSKIEAPTGERFESLRTAVLEAVPELKGKLMMGLLNEAGALVSQGDNAPGPALEGFNIAEAVKSPSVLVDVAGVTYLLLSAPTFSSEKNEIKVAGSAFVAAPILPDNKMLESVVSARNLTSQRWQSAPLCRCCERNP